MLNLITCAGCEYHTAGKCAKGGNIFVHALASGCPVGKFAAPTIVAGAVGLMKAALHIGRATDEVIEKRGAICAACPNAEAFAGGIATRCKLCRCTIFAKVLNADSFCPDSPARW